MKRRPGSAVHYRQFNRPASMVVQLLEQTGVRLIRQHIASLETALANTPSSFTLETATAELWPSEVHCQGVWRFPQRNPDRSPS